MHTAQTKLFSQCSTPGPRAWLVILACVLTLALAGVPHGATARAGAMPAPAAASATLAPGAPPVPATPPATTDLFADLARWQTIASDGVEIHIAPDAPGPSGKPSLRIDFNFARGAGYGGVVLPIALELTDNFTLDLALRGSGLANNLELKLADASGLNVHWVNRREFEWPAQWAALRNQRRHFHFAWGPSPAEQLKSISRVEIIIASNHGGRGSVWVDGLTLRPLAPSAPTPKSGPFLPDVRASATSAADEAHGAPRALEADGEGWRASSTDAAPALTLDLGSPREIGGMAITWPDAGPAAARAASALLESSDDAQRWSLVTRIDGPCGTSTWLPLPGVQSRFLRLSLAGEAANVASGANGAGSERAADGANADRARASAALSLGIRRVELLPPELGDSPNAFWAERARRARRGLFPRTLLNEQSYWTVVGLPDDDREALINEEGQIEVDKRSFSLEPFLKVDGRVLTWADGTHTQTLRNGWVPIPTVTRSHEGVTLAITPLVAGTGTADAPRSSGSPVPGDNSGPVVPPGRVAAQPPARQSCLYPSYVVTNTSGRVISGQLAVVVRPFQVLPPWQDLNITGGFAPIRSIITDERGIVVNDSAAIVPVQLNELTAVTSDQGDAAELFASGTLPTTGTAACSRWGNLGGAASAAIIFDFTLSPGERAVYFLIIPMHGTALPESPSARPVTTDHYNALAAATTVAWHRAVNRVNIDPPDTPSGRAFADTLRAQQAYVLINRDGKGFQPGSRTYERSWIRDGALTSSAMLALGHAALVKDFLDWYTPYQFESGKVPCVVDRRGPDPVPENDSHGELIYALANYFRFTHDTPTVERHFPAVRKAVAYMQQLRSARLTDEFSATGPARCEPGKPAVPALAFRGLLPESISHEGYSAKPMHSYWDDLFALRGLTDAAYLAGVVGDTALADSWKTLADDFRESLLSSIGLAQAAHSIDYVPGCVELGDFDSTSTTIAVWPVADSLGHAPATRASLEATFERAWREFVKRRDDPSPSWEAFTPYELRHVGAYLRLGHPDRAWAALQWYMSFQRPPAWHHWAEVVWRDPLAPRMIGDMPHTWCGSDFLSAARAMFVYESEADSRLIVAAGLPEEWTDHPSGVSAQDLPTMFGSLSIRIRPAPNSARVVELSGTATPPGGLALRVPSSRPLRSVVINGQPITPPAPTGEVLVPKLPATVTLSYQP